MKKRGNKRKGFAYLLDAWLPPEGAGDAVGCVATSYTFDAAFFEDQCLSRFAGMEEDRETDMATFLLERDERFACLQTAIALVDHHHSQGERSLRWDLLPARPAQGRFHPKVLLLRWAQCLRLVVSSANLTPEGYRRNQEIVCVFDYHAESGAPLALLSEMILFLRRAALALTDEGHARQRWLAFLDATSRVSADWGAENESDARPVVIEPRGHSVFEQLREMLRTPPNYAEVLSPFFDQSPGSNLPATQLAQWVAEARGQRELSYLAMAEETEASYFLHLPQSLQKVPKGVSVSWKWLRLEERRSLHAKSLWLQTGSQALYMVGSSNFTTLGYGLIPNCNWEANVAFLSRLDCAEDIWLGDLDTQPFAKGKVLEFKPPLDSEELEAELQPVLPPFFTTAEYMSGKLMLGFLSSAAMPSQWTVLSDAPEFTITDAKTWRSKGKPATLEVSFPRERPPSGLWVIVNDGESTQRLWWPVSIVDASALPPPELFRDLSLEDLLAVLSSTKSLTRVLANRGTRNSTPTTVDTSHTDPHLRVKEMTNSYLLQRTRRVAAALSALRERLERPCSCEASLQWRMSGPIGVQRVAEALERESHSSEETAFLLAELALELQRTTPTEQDCYLPRIVVKQALAAEQTKLRAKVRTLIPHLSSPMAEYLERVLP